ncbi:aldehyde ferredoxin oxidoreductase C-terminal domain-containing protein [Pseudodesulfovibrio sp.]|uniref:aldehyde ferredoxin oxidoreductase family protein n=1 Tax=Pseudodesulfovibrio sp. TaxID=2035812 RepID=UPI002626F7B1|nr:aldehyde ferredoxin oxidoreductase C-terminal domain-containing protein [Pseudodesulfovibrio sp.]MDD3311875.1 aldehyde ferredoxin oxidoreductase C-terminal domain-containing protein [Pseudodesulfovibrio sp.]
MASPLCGWTGRVLHVDLSTGEAAVFHPSPRVYARLLGGRGVAGHYLRAHCTLDWDDPDLPLCFFTGPLTGTAAPASSRGVLLTRSPLTSAVSDCSVGGGLAVRLKRAGWDGLIVTGKSDVPCGIEIADDDVRVVETGLWGETTDAVFDRLSGPGTSVAAVGPAAENGSPLASVVVDRFHAALRGGPGLAWAARRLKYVSVRGTGAVRVRDEGALAAACEAIRRLAAASPVLMGRHGFASRGTGALYDLMDSRRMMPTDNFRATRFSAAPRLNAEAYRRAYRPEPFGCEGCHIRCKLRAADGRAIPDYDAMAHFSALIGNDDPELVMSATALCGRLGLDPISAASAMACRRELTGEPCDGRTVPLALHDMAHGGPLSGGSLDFAESCDRPELSMSVKGLDLPAYDPRGAYGMALAFAVNTRGGCHQHANPLSHEVLRKPVATDRFTFSGKARILKIAEDQNAAADSLGVCRLIFLAAGLEEYARAYTAVTGLEASGGELQALGERICYQERIMNSLNGFGDCEDDLPPRFFSEPGASGGGVEMPPLDREAFLAARARYYRVRGLDESGRPTPETAGRLDLELEP